MSELTATVASSGFRKRRDHIFTLILSDVALGWVGLNRASYRDAGRSVIDINPVIGVRYQEIERIAADLAGWKCHEYIPPTLTVPVGYLMPQRSFTQWTLERPQETTVAAEEVAAAIHEYGLPFMRRNSSLDAVTARLSEAPFADVEHRSWRLPVAYLLAGDLLRSLEELERWLDWLGDRADPAAVMYRRFADNFRSFAGERLELDDSKGSAT